MLFQSLFLEPPCALSWMLQEHRMDCTVEGGLQWGNIQVGMPARRLICEPQDRTCVRQWAEWSNQPVNLSVWVEESQALVLILQGHWSLCQRKILF